MNDSGTLGLVIATNNGVVIASDTRQTLGNGQFCDGANKILEVSHAGGLLLMVTGRRGFYPIQMSLAPDPCQFARTTHRDIDIAQVAKSYIEHNLGETRLEEFDLVVIAQQCTDALIEYFKRAPYYHPAVTQDPFSSSIVLLRYDSATQRSIVRSVELSVSDDFKQLRTRGGLNESFRLDDPSEPVVLGEGEYLSKTVIPRLDAFSVSSATRKEFETFPQSKFPKVKDRSTNDAVRLATDLIGAASESAKTRPARSGIGGPIEVYFLGSRGAVQLR